MVFVIYSSNSPLFITSFTLQEKPNAPNLILSPEKSTVTFEDIKFGYVPERQILNGLSFRVPAGKKIAIVGGSGSG